MATIEIWDLWYPMAASTGLAFARGRLNATDILLVHSAPEYLTVTVRADTDELVAHGQDLPNGKDSDRALDAQRQSHISFIQISSGWQLPLHRHLVPRPFLVIRVPY